MVLDPGGFVASGSTWATDMSLAASRSNYMLSWMADVSGPVLYGVRVDWQLALRAMGYNLRGYLPFGADWGRHEIGP